MVKMAKNGSLAITVLAFLMFVMRNMKKLKNTKKTGSHNNFQLPVKSTDMVEHDKKQRIVKENDSETLQAELRSQILTNIRKDPSSTANSFKKMDRCRPCNW